MDCLGNFRSITLCARGKHHPNSSRIASNHRNQAAEEEGVGMDVEWTMLFDQINVQAGRWKGDLSVNVYSSSSVKAFRSLSLNISHTHVHF